MSLCRRTDRPRIPSIVSGDRIAYISIPTRCVDRGRLQSTSFYEKLFDIVIEEQHVSLIDIFGGQDVVEEFWTRPDTSKDGQSIRKKDTADSTPWLIPFVNALG
jgi:hypothetical protein